MRVRGRIAGSNQIVDVCVVGDRITGIGAPMGVPDHGGEDVIVAPAFLDCQVNGYAGHDFNTRVWTTDPASPDHVASIVDLLAPTGTGLLLPTLVTNDPANIREGIAAIVAAREHSPALAAAIVGIHLEGPFLSPVDGPRGAHPLQYIRDPDWDLFASLQEAAGGLIRILTIAPERPGAIPLIERAADSGVVVSIGHSDASPEDVQAAVAAGARMSTHLGNGSHAMLPRHPNYIWEQLAADELTAGIIADLQHLPASVLKSFCRCKSRSRVCLVSDCVNLGGLPPGLYNNGLHEVLPSGRVNLAGTPYLAGAGHCLDTCVANAIRETDLGEEGAVDAVTRVPARLLGLDSELGALGPGLRADLTCFRVPATGPLEVTLTMVAGKVKHVA